MINACDAETGQRFTDVDIVDMLMTMIAAGHETTAHAMTWMLYNLAKQPELQELLAEEVELAASGRPFDGQALRNMVHLEAFIKESMRVYPSVPLLMRVSAKGQQIGGFNIKKGAVIFLPILAIHRHEDLWEDPNVFDHTRFLRVEPSTLSRTAYFPFGAGPRVCIGNAFTVVEMVAGIATLLQQVRLRPAADCEDFTFMHLLTLKPSNGLPLEVEFL
ncbi:MAG: cytochrome P450 [Pseudomonadota bacterium]